MDLTTKQKQRIQKAVDCSDDELDEILFQLLPTLMTHGVSETIKFVQEGRVGWDSTEYDFVREKQVQDAAKNVPKKIADSAFVCPRCGSRKVEFIINQESAGDEGSTLRLRCLCGKQWRIR